MKVQITVDEQLWRKARVAALERGQNLGELVGEALGDLFVKMYKLTGIHAPHHVDVVVGKREKQGGALGQVATEKGGSTPPLPTNPVSEPPVSVKSPLVEELDWVKCAMCEDRFIREKMKHHKKTNTYLCEDCADK